MQIAKLHWPVYAAIAVLLLVVASLFKLSTGLNGGQLVYALDDPYIHMAIARNFAHYGVWGVTRYEFSSSTSSLLWTLILSAIELVKPTEYAPLILNVAFASLVIVIADYFLAAAALVGSKRFIILLGLIFLTPLPPIILSGMEHTAHFAVAIAFVYVGVRAISRQTVTLNQPEFIWLIVLSMLAPMIRYESLAFVSIAVLFLALRKRPLHSFIILSAGLLPLLIYGLVSESHGAFWLPNSVLLKGSFPDAGALVFFQRAYGNLINAPHVLLLLVLGLCLLLGRRQEGIGFWERDQVLLMFFAGTTILHLFFASVGWFYRYEAYLLTLGIMINGTLIMQRISWHSLAGIRSRALSVIVLVLVGGSVVFLVARSIRAHTETPMATANVYNQQYQMATFLRIYYQGVSVAANDIGAINFLADIRCLDLVGLGSVEVIAAKLNREYKTRKMAELAQARKVKIAMIYSAWFEREGGVPAEWKKVGDWTTPNCVVCGNPTVSFYAVDPAEVESLKMNLKSFAAKLPPAVIQR